MTPKGLTNKGPAYIAGYIMVLQESINYTTMTMGIPENYGCYVPEASGITITEDENETPRSSIRV